MDFQTIILKKEEHIATITLNRPDRLNTINGKMEDELVQALKDISQDSQIRVMVLTGAGKAFCAGGDISPGSEQRLGTTVQEISRSLRRTYQGTTLQLYDQEIPTIAMVNGVASGWGLDLVLACDMRIGSENARLNSAFVRVGLTPATGGVWLMPRTMGLAKAYELAFTGDFVDAKEAERLVILNRVVPAADLEKETMALAAKIAKYPPLAVKLIKLQMRQALQTDLKGAFELAANCQSICITSEDCKEAMAAMFEKREAVFKGK